jgi:RNA polymerase sigma-70 factor (ECF subfamily)
LPVRGFLAIALVDSRLITRSVASLSTALSRFDVRPVRSEFDLDALRKRKSRQEQLAGSWLPEPIVRAATDPEPERDTIMADSVGLALLVVLESLTPAERLAFVLHDVFGVPFDEIAPLVERSPAAARQLASQARRRVRAEAPEPDADLEVQRRAVDAFLAAARDGDFEGLLRLLDPDVVLRVDGGPNAPRPFAQPPIVGSARQWRAGRCASEALPIGSSR